MFVILKTIIIEISLFWMQTFRLSDKKYCFNNLKKNKHTYYTLLDGFTYLLFNLNKNPNDQTSMLSL